MNLRIIMKFLSLLTLTALLSVTACSHHMKKHCDGKDKTSCSKEEGKKKCCDDKKDCKDGSCEKPKKS